MHPTEYRTAFSLAAIFACRVLGMMMVLPVFALYAQHLEGATPLLMGVALGVYGLTQAVFQIPLGFLSDRIGRRPVIAVGLLMLLLGSLCCALTHSIVGMMMGRALQGTGAIGSTIFAFLADTVRPQHLTTSHAIVGLLLGVSFSVAMVLGPMLDHWLHLQGIFVLTAVLSVLAMGILMLVTPAPAAAQRHRDVTPITALLRRVGRDTGLMRINVSILLLHAILTAAFMGFPVLLTQSIGRYAGVPVWWVYLPVLVGAFVAMFPAVLWAEKKRRMKPVFLGSVSVLVVALLLCYQAPHHLAVVVLGLWLFFTAFSVLEAILPSLASKMAPAGSKGAVMGLYSTFQFAGIFVGGVFGGWMHHHYGVFSVFIGCALLASLWWVLVVRMKAPRHVSTHMFDLVEGISAEGAKLLEARLGRLQGVVEVMVAASEKVIYTKVDSAVVRKAVLSDVVHNFNDPMGGKHGERR